jgi:bacterial/archaeal transporter family-2 protein
MRGALAGVALLSGAALACQVGFNSELRARLGHPLLAALASFAVGTALLALYALAARPALPEAGRLARAPWWAWLGGVVGAGYVAAAAAFGARLGASAWFALVVTGQVLASLALDHFGLIGFPPHPLGAARVVGVLLLLAGVALVLRS